MPTTTSPTLISELIKLRIIEESEVANLEDSAKKAKRDLSQILIDTGRLSDKDLTQLKSRVYRLPALDLETIDLDKGALSVISEDVVNFYKIVPFAKTDEVLRVGIINPEDIDALEALKFIAADKGLTLEKYVVATKILILY